MPYKPNILFVVADQHNAKVLGHQGHPHVQTPHLDRLASDGTRFDHAICQSPICTPSRVSFLSGQYCHNHGYYGLDGPRPQGLPSLFSHFRAAGYATAAIGKIHCPEYWVEDAVDLFHDTCGCSILGRSAAYEDFLRQRGKLDFEDHLLLPEFGAKGRQSMDGRASALTFEESQEGWISSQINAFMRRSQEADQPFLAFASLPRPHQCSTPSEPFWSMYQDQELTLPPNADYDLQAAGKPPNLRNMAAQWRRAEWALFEPKTYEAARDRSLRAYLGAVSQVDHAVGQMLDCLDQAGLADSTIVIYTADHGDFAGEHGVMEKAPGIGSDAITRVPLIWRGPGISAGHTSRELVELVDISTTLCSLSGVPPMLTSDGLDLSPLLRGQSTPLRRVAVTEWPMSKSLRRGPWRFVYYPRGMFPDAPEFGELYNLDDDPWEMHNLYFADQHQPLIHDLRHDLLEWQIMTTRPRTGLNCTSLPPDQSITRYKRPTLADGKLPPPDRLDTAHPNYS